MSVSMRCVWHLDAFCTFLIDINWIMASMMDVPLVLDLLQRSHCWTQFAWALCGGFMFPGALHALPCALKDVDDEDCGSIWTSGSLGESMASML